MKISELITELQKIKDQNGDLDCLVEYRDCCNYDEGFDEVTISENTIQIVENSLICNNYNDFGKRQEHKKIKCVVF